jgi:endonuclease YncB( thermonuclease family)
MQIQLRLMYSLKFYHQASQNHFFIILQQHQNMVISELFRHVFINYTNIQIMKFIASFLLILLISSSFAEETQAPPTETYEPEVQRKYTYGSGVKALSGDTFEFDAGDSDASERIIVRLVGLKAPKKGEPYFEQAKAHLNNLVTYKFFKVEVFEEVKGNGIEIRDVIVGLVQCLEMGPTHGSFLNEIALDAGLAKHNTVESLKYEQKMHDAFAADEQEAIKNKKGMYAENASSEKVPDTTRQHGFASMADIIQTGTKYTKLDEVERGNVEPIEIDIEEYMKNIDL